MRSRIIMSDLDEVKFDRIDKSSMTCIQNDNKLSLYNVLLINYGNILSLIILLCTVGFEVTTPIQNTSLFFKYFTSEK